MQASPQTRQASQTGTAGHATEKPGHSKKMAAEPSSRPAERLFTKWASSMILSFASGSSY